MISRSIALFSFTTLGLAVATPAQAMTGHDAAVACEARGTPKCLVDYGSKGDLIILTDDGYVISCPTPSGQCTITTRPPKGKPKPAHPKLLNPGLIPHVLAH